MERMGMVFNVGYVHVAGCCFPLPQKYAPSAPYALKGVSFKINHSEKVGVVGRTGSGKSTLLLALYRMFDLDRGRIIVDGVDIASLPLKRLRPSLSIIPQEPVVFSGTVRTNLDPFNEFQDHDLWAVIREVRILVVKLCLRSTASCSMCMPAYIYM
jgi:ABC-type multidrug transport system fused ATPase/permease subunit